MLRALRIAFRRELARRGRMGRREWERLRQLWLQGDLFEAEGTRVGALLPSGPLHPPRGAKRGRPRRQPPRTHPDDVPFLAPLAEAYACFNVEHFGGRLHPVLIRISRRMKNRLGHYMAATGTLPAEIALSRRHLRRDAWEEVLHTLLHEMVHQWQDEQGHPVDHGVTFRAKARAVGISARATRPAAPARRPLAARAMHRRRA